MSIQINYLLIFTDADNITKIQVFTEPGEAYKTMEIEYETTILQLKQDETEFKNSIDRTTL